MAIRLTILKAIFILLAFFTLGLVFGQATAQQIYDRTLFLSQNGCHNVKIEINNVAYYLADEQPESMAELIERYTSGK